MYGHMHTQPIGGSTWTTSFPFIFFHEIKTKLSGRRFCGTFAAYSLELARQPTRPGQWKRTRRQRYWTANASHPITWCQLVTCLLVAAAAAAAEVRRVRRWRCYRCSLGQGGCVSTRSDVATNDIDVFDVTMADNNRSQCVTATPFRRHFPSWLLGLPALLWTQTRPILR